MQEKKKITMGITGFMENVYLLRETSTEITEVHIEIMQLNIDSALYHNKPIHPDKDIVDKVLFGVLKNNLNVSIESEEENMLTLVKESPFKLDMSDLWMILNTVLLTSKCVDGTLVKINLSDFDFSVTYDEEDLNVELGKISPDPDYVESLLKSAEEKTWLEHPATYAFDDTTVRCIQMDPLVSSKTYLEPEYLGVFRNEEMFVLFLRVSQLDKHGIYKQLRNSSELIKTTFSDDFKDRKLSIVLLDIEYGIPFPPLGRSEYLEKMYIH